jgi:hypothetical protein
MANSEGYAGAGECYQPDSAGDNILTRISTGGGAPHKILLDLLRKSESSKISTAKLLTFTPGQTDFRKRSNIFQADHNIPLLASAFKWSRT